jgi:hypothetical protein
MPFFEHKLGKAGRRMDGAVQCVQACVSVARGHRTPLVALQAVREEIAFQKRLTPGLWIGFVSFLVPLVACALLVSGTVFATRAIDAALYGERFRPIQDGSAGQMKWDPATGTARIEGAPARPR